MSCNEFVGVTKSFSQFVTFRARPARGRPTPRRMSCQLSVLTWLAWCALVGVKGLKRQQLSKPDAALSLHDAAKRSRSDIVTELLRSGSDVNALSSYGETPLLVAAGAGAHAVVRVLIAHGADVDLAWQVDDDLATGHTPLWRASYRGYVEVVQALLEHGARMENDAFPPLTTASDKGHLGVVKALLKFGAKPDAFNRAGATGLMNACTSGHTRVVAALLKAGADPDLIDANETSVAIGIAAQHGFAEIVRLLLRAGADPDGKPHKSARADWSVPLFAATCYNHTAIVRLLLKAGAHVFAANPAAWEKACVECDGEYFCGGGMTLDLASSKGYDEIERMLLQAVDERGVDVSHAARPTLITVYLDDDTQDAECKSKLSLANDLKISARKIEEIAREIQLLCKPPTLRLGDPWEPAVLEEWTEANWTGLARDGVHTYERFGDVGNRRGHFFDLEATSADATTLDEDYFMSIYERAHFLVSFSDDSIVHYGSASISDYSFEFGDEPDATGGRPEEPWIEFRDMRTEKPDSDESARRLLGGPDLHVYLSPDFGVSFKEDPRNKSNLELTTHIDFYRVSSAPCWSCGEGWYISMARQMVERFGHKHERHPSELRRKAIRELYSVYKKANAAPRSTLLSWAQSPAFAAFATIAALLAVPWLAAQHLERRRRRAIAARALEAARKAAQAEETRLQKKQKKRELERRRQEQQLEALRTAERKREAELEAYTQTLAEREAARRRHELAMRERARREAEAAEDRPLSMPGPSHQTPKARTTTRPTSQTQEERARREVQKARSIEAQHAHTAALREKEAARIAEVMKRLEMRKLGDRIACGEGDASQPFPLSGYQHIDDLAGPSLPPYQTAPPRTAPPRTASQPAPRGVCDGDEALARRLSRLCGACEEQEVMPGHPWCTGCHWAFQDSFTICELCGSAPPSPGYRLCQPCRALARGEDTEGRCDWIATLPVRQYLGERDALQGRVAECIICQEDYVPDVELTMLPTCAHTFHAKCARSWLEKQPTCPVCLTNVKEPAMKGGE